MAWKLYKQKFITYKQKFTMLEKVLFEVNKLSNKELAAMLGITVMGAIKKRKAKSYSLQDAETILSGYKVLFLDRK